MGDLAAEHCAAHRALIHCWENPNLLGKEEATVFLSEHMSNEFARLKRPTVPEDFSAMIGASENIVTENLRTHCVRLVSGSWLTGQKGPLQRRQTLPTEAFLNEAA